MTIIKMIDCIIKGQIEEQQIREECLKSKNKNIEKYQEQIKEWKKEKEEIIKEIEECNLQLDAIREIKTQIQEKSWIGVQGS